VVKTRGRFVNTLPHRVLALVEEIYRRFWTRIFVLIGVFSFVTVSLMLLTGLFTYMRVSADYEVKIEEIKAKFTVDVQSCTAEVARLEGEIGGYQKLIGAFARKGRRKLLGKFEVTAYEKWSCAPYNDGVTAIGLPVGDGIFAVNPEEIAYGSFLHIPAINKYGIAGDTGYAMECNPRSIDIFVSDRKKAMTFGRKKLDVELVEFD
jgi:3D (Asp-Asp-Asp) domain-containing protein